MLTIQYYSHCYGKQYYNSPANNDPWVHMFCKWIHKFNWLNSREFTGCFHMTRASETVPVWPNLWQQAEHGYSREYTWKHVLVEQYQLWTSMTCANWFRNGSLFAWSLDQKLYCHTCLGQNCLHNLKSYSARISYGCNFTKKSRF